MRWYGETSTTICASNQWQIRVDMANLRELVPLTDRGGVAGEEGYIYIYIYALEKD